MLKKIFPFYSIILSLIIFGCGPEEQTITKEEAIAFGKKLEFSLEGGSAKMYDSVCYIKAIAGKVAKEAGMKLSMGYYKGEADALKKIVSGKWSISGIKGCSYDFLRAYQEG